ncbi:hypothetical protein SRHO_G00323380 [Serrasalmus rhombeus]
MTFAAASQELLSAPVERRGGRDTVSNTDNFSTSLSAVKPGHTYDPGSGQTFTVEYESKSEGLGGIRAALKLRARRNTLKHRPAEGSWLANLANLADSASPAFKHRSVWLSYSSFSLS